MCPTRNVHPFASRLAGASNRLGFRLLSLLLDQDPGQNTFISSFSVALALAMTYNGAEGRTREALAEVLGLTGFQLDDVNAANKALMSLGRDAIPGVQLHVANSIWVRQGNPPAPEFVQRISEAYDGKVTSVDLADPATAEVINRWVAAKTNGRIENLVTPDLIELAILVLINAIAFKGIWTSRFDEAKTKNMPFTLLDGASRQLPMMHQSGRYNYLENELFQAVSLPYGTGRISMVICLPRRSVPIAALREALTRQSWERWMSNLAETEGEIKLPRLKLAYEAELLPHLETLGGQAIAETDFRGIGAGPLIISNVIHKTFIEVNEEGTEAAAATAVVMLRSVSYKFLMIVDRPFFCVIRDRDTGLLLFMGFVMDPTRT